MNAYIVGGGIAGLAAAAYLVRDGGVPGERVHVLEQSGLFGGSLDGAGDAEHGYVIRGGRMFERHFECTFDLFGSVPSLDDPGVSVSDEIRAFTDRVVTSSRCRLVVDGERLDGPELGLRIRDKWDLGRLSLSPEPTLHGVTIEEYFSSGFFETNFWHMWCTMFAFQPWHGVSEFRRYMRRFMHLMPGFNRLEGIHRTVYNQYDSLVLPLTRWLAEHGVRLETNAAVADIELRDEGETGAVSAILLDDGRDGRRIELSDDDVALITLGSMTEDSSLGSMGTPVAMSIDSDLGAWSLWKRIARHSPVFGRPEAFCSDPQRTHWESFTVTLTDPYFFEFMERFTGNPAGTGGLVTFRNSSWLMSVVLAYQPHFINQPEGVLVFWGYALHPERNGDLVGKPMSECSGREILDELFHHLPIGEAAHQVIDAANCIPCEMPFITSQFMPRSPGDRPAVIPEGVRNLAFLGQFCEVPEDCVFTVEYSVRTAQMAVYGLLNLPRRPTPMYRGYLSPGVVLRALKAMT